MSYDPSHRMPPRQERWPTATPAEGWPSYRDGEQEDLRYGAQGATAGYRHQAGHQATLATAAYPAVANGYDTGGYDTGGYDTGGYDTGGTTNGYRADGYSHGGYGGTSDGYAGAGDGYAGAGDGYAGAGDGYAGAADDFDRVQDGYGRADHGYTRDTDGYAGVHDGHAGAGNGYDRAGAVYTGDAGGYDWSGNGHGRTANGYTAAADGYAGGAYLGPGSYVEPGAVLTDNRVLTDDPVLTAPDAGVHPDRWQAEQERRREEGRRGPMVGAHTVLLATGVVIGVSTLAAALLKSATSPVSAMGAVFIERTPAALRNAVVHHFGAQGRTVLLLGMYVTFAVVAILIGMLARRDAAACVAGVATFTLFAAFVVITRPAGRVADVIPVVIGGLAGVAAVAWLFRASAPQQAEGSAPLRHGRGGTRRRTR
jgi:hypothetical protein